MLNGKRSFNSMIVIIILLLHLSEDMHKLTGTLHRASRLSTQYID